jgi:hypothetical protein
VTSSIENIDEGDRDQLWELTYRADYSVRYHRRHANFLNNINLLFSCLIIFASGAAFGDLLTLAHAAVLKVCTAAIAFISLLQVLTNLGANGARHSEWMKRWSNLQTEIELDNKPSKKTIARWIIERSAIENDCVAELRALTFDCENKAATFFGIKGRQRQINLLQRLFIHFGTFQQKFPIIDDQ